MATYILAAFICGLTSINGLYCNDYNNSQAPLVKYNYLKSQIGVVFQNDMRIAPQLRLFESTHYQMYGQECHICLI